MGYSTLNIIGRSKRKPLKISADRRVVQTPVRKFSVTIFIPCFNEESTIAQCIESCLAQEYKANNIVVIDDSSTDNTPRILKRFGDKITVVRTPKNTGNKSHAQEFGFKGAKTDLMVTTDADTILHPEFLGRIVKNFDDPKVVAAGGYVRSMKYNWLTRARAVDYVVGQNIHKLAQSYLGFMFVIPGAAGAFRTKVFQDHLTFDHDTITEDLDFTYKLHKRGLKIAYDRSAVVFTQDPTSLYSYINQMRRWFGGGWQNLSKHLDVATMHPAQTLELSLMYIEGLVFATLLFVIPLLNITFALYFIVPYLLITSLFSIYAAIHERRGDLLLNPVPYLFLMYINAYIFIEQFIKEFVLRKKNLVWFKPERISL
ncbi:MAG: glycosyltransferase [Candidatus Woesebacteria bacterium]